ncbi:MAG TPA: tRNA 2-selenouridine(34) synthase MnmH [Bacteroidales bacterium]|nr:tRNA 2-selenouridine(34) synthase MnmH [Bacteroidales bacterium]HBZ21965.1 tRNA 2-selenouridine(34) synthase MnmH [Bacteroidales bacterium]
MIYLPGNKIDISTFLDLAEKSPVIDVRSPSEYNSGHIPGAINIPLFDDREREAVGIKYKKRGREKAIIEGLKLSGPSMHVKLEKALKISKGDALLIHCWRGGMRSEAMAWLFSLAGIETKVLEGGYKAYRHFILCYLSVKRNMIILGGLTGSGKTQILDYLKREGHQVIDLEKLARHKGSAFGSLGQLPQPTTEHFANLLFEELKQNSPDQPLWLEDESRNIGNVFMPEEFYLNMQQNPVVVLLMDIKTRLPRLIGEYSCYSSDVLLSTIMKISRRLGGDRTKEATEAVRSGDYAKAIEITLQYYDKTYLFGLGNKQRENVYYVKTSTDDIETNARLVIEAAGRIKR